MSEYLDDYVIFLASVLAIVNPFSTIPTFISLTRRLTSEDRRRIPWRTATAALVILIAAYFVGEGLLRFFSISIASLRIAGGLIILGTAWSMLQARNVEAKRTEEEAEGAQGDHGVAIVPLAIPLTAGPGAISLMIVAAGATQGFLQDAAAISAVFLVSVSVFIVLRSAGRITALLGETGMGVASRLMGLILAALAIEFIASGVGTKFPGLLQ